MGAQLPGSLHCGPALRLPHAGRGVIINAQAVIGAGVTIYHGVTLGQGGPDPYSCPTLADNAYIGAGAIIIGKVRVGDGARVGAGAVVVHDVPDGATAVGVPANVQSRA